MFILRSSLAVGLAFALTAAVSAAPNRSTTARGRNNSRYGIEGTVVQVHHDRAQRGMGWIKIRRGQHHRYGRSSTTAAAASGRNRSRGGGQGAKFDVNSSTRFERMGQSGNGGGRATRMSFRAIRTGERVRIVPGSGQRRAAREVVVLSNQSNRSRHRRGSGNRSSQSRRNGSHRRNSLIGSRVLSRLGQLRNLRANRPAVTRLAGRQAVRHSLIEGRVARQVRQINRDTRQINRDTRQINRDVRRVAVAHPVVAKAVKQKIKQVVKHDIKQAVKNHKTPPKHTTVAKRPASKPAHTNHPPTHTHATSHPHSSGHTHAPSHAPSAHHKR